MSNLDKARVWADQHHNISDHRLNAGVKAAAKVIRSLPDQWVDMEKVLEIADDLESLAQETALKDRFVEQARRLRNLTTPKLPTLADMTAEERQACLRAQAKTGHEVGILVWVNEDTEIAQLITKNNGVLERKFEDVTPLTGEPKLEWPGEIPRKPYLFGGTSSESDLPDMSVSERIERTENLIKPEDVPANEPWLIEVDDMKAIGTHYARDSDVPWSVAALDGSFAGDFHDNEVTLIHKLVPETHKLPKGMRLADHKEYGRVVVSPEADTDGDYKVFYSISNSVVGSTWKYADENELTFLGGGG